MSNRTIETLSAALGTRTESVFLNEFAAFPLACRGEEYRIALSSVGATLFMMNAGLTEVREAWLVKSEGRVVGRVHANTSWTREGVGYIGFYEVDLRETDHADVARELLGAATTWLAGHGALKVYGPIDWCTWFSYRFQTAQPEGYKSGRFFWWEPVNPPEFLTHWEAAGFVAEEHYHTKAAEHSATAPMSLTSDLMKPAYDAAVAEGYRFRPMKDGDDFMSEAEGLYEVNASGFAGNFLFEPIPFALYKQTISGIVGKVDFSLSFWVHSKDDRPVGYIYCFADGEYAVGKSVVIMPGHRGKAISPALMHLTSHRAVELGIPTAVSALIRRGNVSDRITRTAEEHAVAPWRHEYVLYGKSVTPIS